MSKCKLCGEKTANNFNVDFKKVPVCECCAVAITMQQIFWWAKQPIDIGSAKKVRK